MVTIYPQFKTPFFNKNLASRCEWLIIKDLQKQRISFDSHKNPPPFLYLRQSNRLDFSFFPQFYPQKPPCGVSGKLSSTPKTYKTAHLLRFFGKHLCHHQNLTQHVTYYKSKRVYYNIPGVLLQAAIHTRRDSNCRQKTNCFWLIILMFI